MYNDLGSDGRDLNNDKIDEDRTKHELDTTHTKNRTTLTTVSCVSAMSPPCPQKRPSDVNQGTSALKQQA